MPVTLKCAQAHFDHYPVQSGSSSKTYRVTMFRTNELPSCNCTGFMTKRNKNANIIGGGYAGAGAGLAKGTAAWCKHLEEVKNTTCGWIGKPGEKQLQCPLCGGYVVDSASPRLPAGRGRVPSSHAAKAAPRATKASPKLPDPKVLIELARKLSAPEDAPEPEKPKGKTFDDITGKKPTPASPEDAATALANLLKGVNG